MFFWANGKSVAGVLMNNKFFVAQHVGRMATSRARQVEIQNIDRFAL